MKKHIRWIVGGLLLAGFGGFAFVSFNRSIAPYVPFAEARTLGGSVQVAGFPDHQASNFDTGAGTFSFVMKDEAGDQMPVVYAGVKPGNFDQAEKVVVVGRYEGNTLHADQILVKCPSKYDDMAADEYSKDAAEGKETH